MRKIVFILCIIILNIGCSVSRKQLRNKSGINESKEGINILENITNQNLTARSFYIERAEFRIKSNDGEKSGLGTIKFCMPDKFLISIKSNAGIEIARIFLTGDSIMINDRFSKKLFYGSASYLKEKYGVTTAVLPVIFGDYINEEKQDSTNIKCINGKLNIEGRIKNLRIKYKIDCEKGKSILTIPENRKNDNLLQILYSEFFNYNKINIPGIIKISEGQSNTTIEIRIEKIVLPWEGTIDFIPGKQYEKIHLL